VNGILIETMAEALNHAQDPNFSRRSEYQLNLDFALDL
jgi:hypothetical protein